MLPSVVTPGGRRVQVMRLGCNPPRRRPRRLSRREKRSCTVATAMRREGGGKKLNSKGVVGVIASRKYCPPPLPPPQKSKVYLLRTIVRATRTINRGCATQKKQEEPSRRTLSSHHVHKTREGSFLFYQGWPPSLAVNCRLPDDTTKFELIVDKDGTVGQLKKKMKMELRGPYGPLIKPTFVWKRWKTTFACTTSTQYMKSGKTPSLVGIGLSQLHKNRARLIGGAARRGAPHRCDASRLRHRWGALDFAPPQSGDNATIRDRTAPGLGLTAGGLAMLLSVLFIVAWVATLILRPLEPRAAQLDLGHHDDWILSLFCRSLLIWSPGR